MLIIILGFVLGVVLALVGLRLLASWNERPLVTRR
jgi:hypothetical protein